MTFGLTTRLRDYRRWHAKFAWSPVRVSTYDIRGYEDGCTVYRSTWAWLRWVERRYADRGYYEYQLPNKEGKQ